jgi:integrase
MAKAPGGARKKGNTYERRFTYKGKQYSVYGKTSDELDEKTMEKKKEVDAGAYGFNKDLKLDKYFVEWIERRHQKNLIKGSTYNKYKSYYYKHISPQLGKMKVKEIEKRHIENFQTDLNKKNKAEKGEGKINLNTCYRIMELLNNIFNSAVKDEIIAVSPSRNVDITKVTEKKATETYHRALTVEEQELFMNEMKNDYYYEFIAMMISTGARYGEIAALNWQDIDTKKNVIHINKTVTCNKDGKTVIGETPKTSSSTRDIPITEGIKGILAEQKAKYKIITINEARIFSAPRGGLVLNFQINKAIANCLKRLEESGNHMDHITSHSMRDTFATRFVEQGGTLLTLKTILGHESLSMTADLYAHVLNDTKQTEMDKVTIII